MDNQLYANERKCLFGQKELDYLNLILSQRGVVVDESKVATMIAGPKSKSLKELREFFGLKGYCRRFMEAYGKIAWPLTQLLKKDSFGW